MKAFWSKYRALILDALARAIRTMAQTAVGAIGGSAVFSEVNWAVVFSSAGVAGVISILMSADRLTAPLIAPDSDKPPAPFIAADSDKPPSD